MTRTVFLFLGVSFGRVHAADHEVVVAVVVGFSRTDDGHNHRQGATSCTEPGHSTHRDTNAIGTVWWGFGKPLVG